MDEEEVSGRGAATIVQLLTIGTFLVLVPAIGVVGAIMTQMTWLAVAGGISLALGVALVAVEWCSWRSSGRCSCSPTSHWCP